MGNYNLAKQQQQKIINQRQNIIKNGSAASYSIQNEQKQELLNGKYLLLGHLNHKTMGKSMLVKHNLGGQLLILKKINLDCSQQLRILHQQLLKKRDLYNKSQHLLQIKDIFIQKNSKESQIQHSLYFVTQNFDVSLKQVFYNRLINKKTFDQQQIIQLLITGIKGYSLAQSSGSKNSKARMETILVKQREDLTLSFTVIDDQLIDLKTNYELNKNFSLFSSEIQTAFLSPEQFIAFVNHSKQTIVDQKSGVFSLGATILSLCLMMPVKFIYNNISKFIDGRLLASLIRIATQRYGSFIGDMLSVMLQLSQERRPKFSSLLVIMQDKLSEYQKNNFLSEEPTQNTLSLLQLSIYEGKMKRSTCSSELSFNKQQVNQFSQVDWGLLIFAQNNCKGQTIQKIEVSDSMSILASSQCKSQQNNAQDSSFYQTEKSNIYVGQLKNGQPNGWGTLYYINQQKIMQFLSSSCQKLSLGLQNLLIEKYEGQFKEGVFWGVGRFSCQGGVLLEGLFINGKVRYPQNLVKLFKIDECPSKQ